MKEQFLRTEMLLGETAMIKLAASHVAIFGIGGVGSWCAEALSRAGVGTLTLIDQDEVSLTNLNRQAEALHSTLGQPKVQAMADRIRDINPSCLVNSLKSRYESATREEFFRVRYDYIVDAIDLVSCKLDLAETALRLEIPIVMALGTGNKLDPAQLRLADIAETSGCPLARVMRRELRRRGIEHLRVVFSPEQPAAAGAGPEAPPPGRHSVPASSPWVPAVAGLLLGSAVVRDLIEKERDRSC